MPQSPSVDPPDGVRAAERLQVHDLRSARSDRRRWRAIAAADVARATESAVISPSKTDRSVTVLAAAERARSPLFAGSWRGARR